jgi:hypothetical protein
MNHEVAESHESRIHVLPRTTKLTLPGLQGFGKFRIAPGIEKRIIQPLSGLLAALLCCR